jgi:hypothetical protein
MNNPSASEIMDCIDHILHARYRDDYLAIMGYRESEKVLWFRTPDGDGVFKITVEELPRDGWPDFPGL